ncbi:carbonic anhydrase [Pseudohyphozyma bogoriensis]|nr:carbonic anhydrase [Pseudohyphozyma bogoriensis]
MSYASAHLPAANQAYVEAFSKTDKGSLPLPPGKKVAILGCMDARLDTHASTGLVEGDSHHIRNAGGRVDPGALRSLVISQQLLGTREIIIIHHTDCGMLTFTTPQAQSLISERLPGTKELLDFPFLEFSDLHQSVEDDVNTLKESPLILDDTVITGFVYHVETGVLEKVV